jgi:hypothetical protein
VNKSQINPFTQPEPVYTQLEEEPEAEETSRDEKSKRKGEES